MTNWIPDVNRFGLPVPPEWFLKILWDQDAALVLLPSRQGRKYLLARRRDASRIVHGIVQQTIDERVHKAVRYSDSELLESHKLVLVDSILSITGDMHSASWMTSCPTIMAQLRNRDMWAAGGAEKYIEKIETQEQAERDKTRADLLDNLDHRASDAWRSYQARTGQRTRVGHGMSRTSRAKIVQVGTL